MQQAPGNINNMPNLNRANDIENEDSNFGKFDFEKLLPILNKSLGWIILFILFSAGAGYLYLRSTRPIYQSASILKIEVKQEGTDILSERMTGMREMDESVLQGEIEIIKSPIIYKRVIDRMDLNVSYYKFGKFLYTELYAGSPFQLDYVIKNDRIFDTEIDIEMINDNEFNLRYNKDGMSGGKNYKFGVPFETPSFKGTLKKTKFFIPNQGGEKFFLTINSQEYLERFIERNLGAKVLNPSAKTLEISFKDFSKEKARDIVNTIDTVYQQVTLSKKNQANEQTLDFLEEQLQKTSYDLQGNEGQIERFVRDTRTTEPKETVTKVVSEIQDMQKQMLTMKAKISQFNQLRRYVQNNQETKQFIPAIQAYEDESLNELIKQLNELAMKRAKAGTTIKSSELAASRRDSLDKNGAIASVLNTIDALVTDLNDKTQMLQNQMDAYEKRFKSLPEQDTEITRLKRFYALYEKFYLLLMERKMEFEIAKAGTVPDFQVLSPASLPVVPISPQKGSVYTLWIVIGIVAGVVLVFVRYVLQDTISTVKELEKLSIAPLLGVVPAYTKEKLKVAKLVVDKNPKSSLSESLRAIRTNIDFLNSGITNKKRKVITVTSTVSGEGKTFIAVNLSGILAMGSNKVILLDLDMRKPKLNQAFDIPNDKGMSSILIGKNTWKEVMYHTPLPNVDIIPAGPPPPNPAELLMRPELDELINELHQHYDIVLIDSPPVGLVTDGLIIMQKADLPLYVVRNDYSKRMYVKNINKLVRVNGFKNLGVIMNGLDKLKTYGYGYGYGYDYYTDDDTPQGFDVSWFRTLLGLK